MRIEDHRLRLYLDGELLLVLLPDDADQLAAALNDLAGDLRQDVAARAWSQSLLNTAG